MASYPWYVWMFEIVGTVGIPLVTTMGLYRAVADSSSRRTALATAGGFAVIWSAWIVASAILADNGAYQQSAVTNRPWIGVAAGGALLGLLAATTTRPVRAAFARPPSLARLVWPQSVRVVGVVFLIAMALGGLPAVFALPAGLGDIAVGLSAPMIARRLARGDRSRAVWFNVLGLLDLVVAVSLGSLAALGPARVLAVSPSTADIALLPLVLVPTTAVPLAMVLHIISLARLRRVPSEAAQPAAVVSLP